MQDRRRPCRADSRKLVELGNRRRVEVYEAESRGRGAAGQAGVNAAGRAGERLVLKPNDDYGGAGVVLGWEVDDATWERSLQTALERPFIVQQRIPLPTATFPSLVDGKVVFADRIVDTAPFVFGGAFVDGCLTRISTATLVNVTAGGGSTIPTFIAEPR
jgi:uncharacterized circularly permuted ATP-grasp superfamily protein